MDTVLIYFMIEALEDFPNIFECVCASNRLQNGKHLKQNLSCQLLAFV